MADRNGPSGARAVSIVSWLLAAVALALPAGAAERGFSNYVPGTYGDFGLAIAPPKGVYVRNNTFSYSADRTQIIGQNEVKVDAQAWVNYTTAAFVTDHKILGARYAAVVGLPIVHSNVRTRQSLGLPADSEDTRFGVGDFFVTPVSLLWTAGKFHFNLYEYIVTPTGAFDQLRAANTGFGYWSFQTAFATTYHDADRGFEASLLIGHTYNTENPDSDYKTGQELFVEYFLNQTVSPTLTIGVHGYVQEQLTGDSGRGAIFGDFKSEAAGIGPAFMWTPKVGDRTVTLIGKWLHEYHAVNRFKGDFVTATFVKKF